MEITSFIDLKHSKTSATRRKTHQDLKSLFVQYRYEREEAFLALNLTVKNATLQDSLDQFVKGELLEGDNAYFCDKCGEKVQTWSSMII